MKRKPNNANLRMESLEKRNLMAGDVTVNVLDGNLLISGDQKANGIELTSTAVEGQFIVTGIDAGGSPTSVNGDSTPLVVEGVDRNVLVRMGNGDDRLVAPNLDIEGRMLVRMGAGDDHVRIGAAEADEAVVDIDKGLYLHLGTGDDQAAISNVRTRRMRIGGGAGNDRVGVHHAVVEHTMHLSGRAGDDEIRVDGVHARRLAIHGGSGEDSANVTHALARSFTVNMSVGDDQIVVHNSAFQRAALFGARGDDSLATDLALEDIYVRGFEHIA